MSSAAAPIASVVSGAAPPPAAAAPPAAAPPVFDATAAQRQIEELKEQVAEGQRTSQYWADKARSAAPAPAAAAAAEEEPDVLEAITTGGAKGFDRLASQRGFIRKDEVEALINDRATSLTKEQELLTQYPDLKKRDSEFFKATAVIYGDLIKQKVPQGAAMELAAQRAELDFMRIGKIKVPGSEPTKEEKEAARRSRIDAQTGEGTSRRPAAPAEDDEELTPEQKHVADAMGVSYEAYAKRAKAGVNMSSKGAR